MTTKQLAQDAKNVRSFMTTVLDVLKLGATDQGTLVNNSAAMRMLRVLGMLGTAMSLFVAGSGLVAFLAPEAPTAFTVGTWFVAIVTTTTLVLTRRIFRNDIADGVGIYVLLVIFWLASLGAQTIGGYRTLRTHLLPIDGEMVPDLLPLPPSMLVPLGAAVVLAALPILLGLFYKNAGNSEFARQNFHRAIDRALQVRDYAFLHRMLERLPDDRLAKTLIYAARDGHGDFVEQLLRRGSPKADGAVQAALAAALAAGREATARRLLEAGANTDRKDANGQPPLQRAIAGGNTSAVELLLAYGADPNATDGNGKPALLLAAELGQADIVRRLLLAGASVDRGDRDRRTALLVAARAHHADCVQALLEHGADPGKTDKHGRTPKLAAKGEGTILDLLARAEPRAPRAANDDAPASAAAQPAEPAQAAAPSPYLADDPELHKSLIALVAANGIETFAQLRQRDDATLLRVRNLGKAKLRQLRDAQDRWFASSSAAPAS